MAETLQFIDERLSNSITAPNPPADPIDRLQPLTFTDWLKYNTQLFTTTGDFLNRYQSYLNNWYKAKGVSITKASTNIQEYYTNLLHDIVINYTSDDEKRFLQNIDIANSRDLAVAVPFFAKKLKDICIYYSTLRDDVQTASLQYNLKGSNTGIENLLYVNIIKTLQAQDVTPQFATLNLNLSTISSNIVIDIEDLYDTYTDYYDISPTLPASAYNVSTGLRNDLFSLNQNDIDPFLYLNINQSILKAILTYPFYLLELGTNFAIDPLVSSKQLNLLKDSDFITTVNDGNIASLNIQTQSQEITKYIGSDFYYIATDTFTAYTSGLLFTANSEFANVLNKRYPTVAAIPSEEFLKTGKELGFFFKPDKIGLINFTNFKFTATIDTTKLQPNTVYYFPDPSKYGNVSGNTKLDFQSPVTFFEENYFNKIDYSNQYRMGDVASDPYFQTFRGYQSREQTLNYSNFGIQRYVDTQDFFGGDQASIWKNIDAYPLAPINKFPISDRENDLVPINKTLVQYKNDVYGNQYGLYKTPVNKQFTTVAHVTSFINQVFDGFVFRPTDIDPTWTDTPAGPPFSPLSALRIWNIANDSPSNVDYNNYGTKLVYSGVTLKTSVTEAIDVAASAPVYVIGQLPNGTSYIDDGASFNDGGNAIIIESYEFAVTDKYHNFSTPTVYNCAMRDGSVFVPADGGVLPDIESDEDFYNPVNSSLYYNALVDGAPQPNGPNQVANYSNAASFLFDSNVFATEIYDGESFYDIDLLAGPCDVLPYSYSYSDTTPDFISIRVPNKNTILDNTYANINTTRKSLYYTRNIERGDFYFRNANSTTIGPLSSTLSATFANFSDVIRNEVYNGIINFDVYYDTLQLETENYLIFDKIEYNYETNEVIGSTKVFDVIPRGNHTDLEKFSSVWFDEETKKLMVAVTTLHYDISASNYKAIYPTIYLIDLINRQTSKIYPTKSANTVTFNELSAFSLFGQNLELNIVTVEKPTLNYSKETGYYTLTYLGKDTANCFYIVTTRFQYLQNEILNITCTLHKPATDVYNITFGNELPNTHTRAGSPYLDTSTIAGSSTGYIDPQDNTFTWGYNTYA